MAITAKRQARVKLGVVDLSRLQFIQFKMDLLAARASKNSDAIIKRATKRTFVLNVPNGSTCLKFSRRYHLFV